MLKNFYNHHIFLKKAYYKIRNVNYFDIRGGIMSEINKSEGLSSLFSGILGGKSNILVLLLLFLLLSQGGFWGKFDENLILIFVVIILLFGGSFRF